MHLSPTSIVKYLKCPYSFFINTKIKLRGEGEGTNTHLVLQHFWEFDMPKEQALQASIDKYWNPKIDGSSIVFENFIKLVRDEKPLMVEERLETEDIVCIPDVVYVDKIIDYKTHKSFTKKIPIQNKIQGVLLSNTLKKLKGLDIKEVEFWYLKKGYVQKLHINDSIQKEVDDIISFVKEKVEKEEFPKNKSNCFMCDFQTICRKEEEYVRKISKV